MFDLIDLFVDLAHRQLGVDITMKVDDFSAVGLAYPNVMNVFERAGSCRFDHQFGLYGVDAILRRVVTDDSDELILCPNNSPTS